MIMIKKIGKMSGKEKMNGLKINKKVQKRINNKMMRIKYSLRKNYRIKMKKSKKRMMDGIVNGKREINLNKNHRMKRRTGIMDGQMSKM